MRSVSWSIRFGVIAIVAMLAAASIPALTSAATADKWGWAVVRSPGKNWTKISGGDGRSSSAGPISVTRLAKGTHRVRFKGVSSTTPGVQVTPMTGIGSICTYYGAGTPSGPVDVYVSCRNHLGQKRDTRFMVSWIESSASHSGPGLAYLWANQPSTVSYDPYYQFVSRGLDANVYRAIKGLYRVKLDGSWGVSGNAQVTAFGTKANHCGVENISSDKFGVDVYVRCRNRKGNSADMKFNFVYTADEGLKGSGGNSWAYLFANKPTVKGYAPTASQYEASPAGNAWIKRLQKGRYRVKLASMPLGGAVQVTAHDSWRRCQIASVQKSVKPQRIEVRCFKTKSHSPADSKFLLSYVK